MGKDISGEVKEMPLGELDTTIVVAYHTVTGGAFSPRNLNPRRIDDAERSRKARTEKEALRCLDSETCRPGDIRPPC